MAAAERASEPAPTPIPAFAPVLRVPRTASLVGAAAEDLVAEGVGLSVANAEDSTVEVMFALVLLAVAEGMGVAADAGQELIMLAFASALAHSL